MDNQVKDPVCGMMIDPKNAADKSEYQGTTYYFCSSHCKMAFDKEPQKHVQADQHAGQSSLEQRMLRGPAKPAQGFSLRASGNSMYNEQKLVSQLVETTRQAGIVAAPHEITNLYVAVKSKPFLILAGPAGTGKRTVLAVLMHLLAGSSLFQSQWMKGHMWSAGSFGGGPLLAEAQGHLNSSKLQALVEEANQPHNNGNLFIGCMERISPAELSLYFSDVAFQVRRGYIMRLPSLHLTEPLPYSSNILLMATMDTTGSLVQADSDLYMVATILNWTAGRRLVDTFQPLPAQDVNNAALFLNSIVRDEHEARRKLAAILGTAVLEEIMRSEQFTSAFTAVPTTIIYLANAWSKEGVGLFDPDNQHNLAVALRRVQANAIDLQSV